MPDGELHDLRPEDRILLAACRRSPAGAGDVRRFTRDLAREGVTRALIRRAYDHHVPGLVLSALERWGVLDELPMEPRIALQTNLLRQRRRSGLLALEIGRVASALDEDGIDCVVLKGASLALQVYESPERRYMNDLDVLVAPDRVDAAIARLLGLGYDNPWSERAVRGYRTFHYHLPLAHRDGHIIELHWELVKPGRTYRLDPAGLMRRAQRFEGEGGVPLFVPTPEDHLLHTAIQQLQDGFTYLARSVDIDRVAARGDPDWDAVVHRAREGGLGTAVAYSLQLARRTLGAEHVPASVVERLLPGPLARAHLSFLRPVPAALEQRFVGHPTASKLLRLWLSQGHRNRISLLAELAREVRDHEPLREPWALENPHARGSKRRGIVELTKLGALQLTTYLRTLAGLATRRGRSQMRFWSNQWSSSERL